MTILESVDFIIIIIIKMETCVAELTGMERYRVCMEVEKKRNL